MRPQKSEVRSRLKPTDLVSFVPMNDLSQDHMWFESCAERKLSDVDGSYTYFANGDVLLAKITPCFENGKLGIARDLRNGVGFGSSEFFVLRPSIRLLAPFLYYFLSQEVFRNQGASVMTGAVGHKRVPKEFVEKTLIPLPPLAEQKRIVAILDEAFEGIAKATENAERNLANARGLVDGACHALFSNAAVDAETVTLGSLLERGWILGHLDGNHGSDYPRKEEFVTDGIPYISANAINDDAVNMAAAKYLSPNRADRIRKGVAQNGDVLFAHNATVGPVAVLTTAEPRVILGTSLTYYRCNLNFIDNHYIAHFMRSLAFRSQYEQIMRQSTRNQVPITKQREFFFTVPRIQIQREISSKLDELDQSSRSLRRVYVEKLAGLLELRQTLLCKAFSGQLTKTKVSAA